MQRHVDPCATVTVEEAARILGVGRNAAYQAVAIGTIPSIRIGRRLLVPRAALDRMLGASPAAGLVAAALGARD